MKKTLIILLFACIVFTGCVKNKSEINVSIDLSKLRPEVKQFIDDIYESEILAIEHTTDSIEKSEKRLPEKPKLFEAGRFKVAFVKGQDKKFLIFQTEEKVGHIAPVIPGKTDIEGYIQIVVVDDNGDDSGITHTIWDMQYSKNIINTKFNETEIDYFIQTLYKKFNNPLTVEQAKKLNQVKDYALAIKFSGKEGIAAYHNDLIKKFLK